MRFGQMQLFPSRARSIDGQQQESDRVDKDGAMSGAPPMAPAVVKQHTFEAPQLGALSGDAGYEYGGTAPSTTPFHPYPAVKLLVRIKL
jgi:hypothetical protein